MFSRLSNIKAEEDDSGEENTGREKGEEDEEGEEKDIEDGEDEGVRKETSTLSAGSEEGRGRGADKILSREAPPRSPTLNTPFTSLLKNTGIKLMNNTTGEYQTLPDTPKSCVSLNILIKGTFKLHK